MREYSKVLYHVLREIYYINSISRLPDELIVSIIFAIKDATSLHNFLVAGNYNRYLTDNDLYRLKQKHIQVKYGHCEIYECYPNLVKHGIFARLGYNGILYTVEYKDDIKEGYYAEYIEGISWDIVGTMKTMVSELYGLCETKGKSLREGSDQRHIPNSYNFYKIGRYINGIWDGKLFELENGKLIAETDTVCGQYHGYHYNYEETGYNSTEWCNGAKHGTQSVYNRYGDTQPSYTATWELGSLISDELDNDNNNDNEVDNNNDNEVDNNNDNNNDNVGNDNNNYNGIYNSLIGIVNNDEDLYIAYGGSDDDSDDNTNYQSTNDNTDTDQHINTNTSQSTNTDTDQHINTNTSQFTDQHINTNTSQFTDTNTSQFTDTNTSQSDDGSDQSDDEWLNGITYMKPTGYDLYGDYRYDY